MNKSSAHLRKPQILIIVLNWKNAPDTIECLESVFKLKSDNFQVALCDNASSDDSVERITAWLVGRGISHKVIEEASLGGLSEVLPVRVAVIKNQKNYGYAGGNNRGLRYALATVVGDGYVWIVNNDVTLDPEALSSLLKEAARRPEVSFFGSTILHYLKRDTIQTQGGDRLYPWLGMTRHIGEGRRLNNQIPQAEVEQKMSYILGAAVFIRLEALRAIGLLDENYFLYFEEIDWATRARRQGMKLGYAPQSWVFHKEGATIGVPIRPGRKNRVADYYLIRNRLVMTRRLFPWALPTVYLAMLFTLVKRCLTGQFDRVWMVLTIMIGTDQPPDQPN